MPYIGIDQTNMEKYLRGDSVYIGFPTPIHYRVMSTKIDLDTGEIQLTGVREEVGNFPVFWGSMFFSWVIMGMLNFFTDKLVSLFGLKPEQNPLRLAFHYGYGENLGYPPLQEKTAYNGYGNRPAEQYAGRENGLDNGLIQELYCFD